MHESSSIENLIKEINAEFTNTHNIPDNFLCVTENKNGSESVWLRELITNKNGKLALNYAVRGRKNAKYFSLTVKKSYIPFISIPDSFSTRSINSDANNTFIEFDSWNDEARELVKSILKYCVEIFEPSDKFGCCSKYAECSKAKKCIHNNTFYAKACWYRKNLESGKIFY